MQDRDGRALIAVQSKPLLPADQKDRQQSPLAAILPGLE